MQKLLSPKRVAPNLGLSWCQSLAAGVEAPADWGNLRSPENYLGFVRAAGFGVARRSAAGSAAGVRGSDAIVAQSMGTHRGVDGRPRPGFAACSERTAPMPLPRARRASRHGRRRARRARSFSHFARWAASGRGHGLDADASGSGVVMEPRLYQLIRQTTPIVDRQFEIEFLEAGVEAFSFTFG